MRVQSAIERKVREALHPQHLEVINESDNHNVPPGSESHFKLVVVSEAFAGKPLVARHRQINAVLAQELREDVHALALHTLTPEEWAARGGAPTSPPCLGGGKR
ncbi:BolA family transcriptional regulator [Ectothiorhodospiraceae bacterium 2226]|nr:BolA family transcriptional regulator [Ectothiorhodospiraceae bacterium 2226]